MLKSKEELINEIEENVKYVTQKKSSLPKIKDELKKYGISEGRVQRIVIHPHKLIDADIREVALFTEQFFKHSGTEANILNPENWFTEAEMTEARQFDPRIFTEETAYPIVLDNVSYLRNNVYSTAISVRQIAKWLDDKVLNYNFEIQRNPEITIRNKDVIRKPKTHKKNVEEMTQLLLSNELVVTTLAFNAANFTADDGNELVYDESHGTLTITSGTRLDILDGYHRCLASKAAVLQNPELDFSFNVLISNYSTRQAQRYQSQLAKAVPIPKARQKQLEASRYADIVVNELIADSELKGKVSSSYRVEKSAGHWVSYTTLSDAIDREFDMNTKLQANKVTNYLKVFFEELIGHNYEAFNNINSVMSRDKIFAGYIAIAGKMFREGEEAFAVSDVLKDVDFSIENPLWQELGYLNEKGSIVASSSTIDRRIADYFRELKI